MDKYRKTIRWILALCCLAYIIWFFAKNTEQLKLVFRLPPLMLVTMAFLIVLSHLVYSYRFNIILQKCSGYSVPLWPWFKMVLLGRFLSTFAPQAGNIYRSVCLKKNYQIPYTRYASSFFSFAWMDTCLNMIYAVAVILAVKPDLRLAGFKALNLLVILIALIAVTPILFVVLFRITEFHNKRLAWLHSKLAEMLTVSVNSLGDGAYMLKMVITGIIAFINSIVILYICFVSLNISIILPSLALFYVVLKLSTQILITPGNLGVREIAYGILSEQMGIGMAQGIIVSAVIRILGSCVVIVLGTVFGGIDLLRHRKDYAKSQQ